MASFPVEILLGIYLGVLVGTVPALLAWAVGFGARYHTGVVLPGWGVSLGAVALAGLSVLGLSVFEVSVATNPSVPAVVTAGLVVAVLALDTHDRGVEMANSFPQRLSASELRSDALSDDAEFVGSEQVRIRVVGEVADMEGYPPLSEERRAELANAELTMPADLRIEELEDRVADRLRTEYDLGDVSVDVDGRGRARVVAAPPFSGLSKRVADGRHAVSVTGLVPTGLARGDEVTIITPNAQVRGTVLSADTGEDPDDVPDIEPLSADESAEDSSKPVRTPTTAGGEGRLTVAVTRTDVQPLLRAPEVKIVVESRGTRREYEVVSMLRRADRQFRRVSVDATSPLAGTALGHADLRDTHEVSVVAVRKASGWHIGPSGETTLEPGDELFAIGTRDALESFSGRVT